MVDAQQAQRLAHPLRDGRLVEMLVARPVGDVLGHGVREQLAFGMLHHQSDRAAQPFALPPVEHARRAGGSAGAA